MNYGQPAPFDTEFQSELLNSLQFLRCGADYAAASPETNRLDVSRALAVIAAIFAHGSSGTGPFLQRLDQANSLNIELRRLRPCSLKATRDATILELESKLSSAATMWAEGNSENPRTATVLRELVTILHRHKFVKRAPPVDLDAW
ncbi:MAG TPA: hypothetical protein VFE47_23640 [Tepidisphaeraceae bacterium]|jgi:hypothetical protein|nr:hypothetical protein [Tepidisphaeraceae bacterium]